VSWQHHPEVILFLYTVVCSCQQINTDSGYQYLSLHRLLIFRSLILCSRGLLATTLIQQK
ncbi:hypothetical protein NY747_13545, partial [Escherichia coli]|nr:hypothetical protein [Escherichia coli]